MRACYVRLKRCESLLGKVKTIWVKEPYKGLLMPDVEINRRRGNFQSLQVNRSKKNVRAAVKINIFKDNNAEKGNNNNNNIKNKMMDKLTIII